MSKIASILAAAAIPLAFLAFWPLYLSLPFATVDRYTHLHAAAGLLWLLLLAAQPAAIYKRQLSLHRLLGRISHWMVPAFAVASILLSHHRLTTMDVAKFTAEGHAHYLPFSATVVFLLAYAGGLWFRRNPDAHGRFMVATGIPLVDPVLGRLMAFYLPPLPRNEMYQAITFTVATLLAAPLVFRFRGDAHARTALGIYFAVLVTLEIGWFVVAPTAMWLESVRWFRGLPLT